MCVFKAPKNLFSLIIIIIINYQSSDLLHGAAAVNLPHSLAFSGCAIGPSLVLLALMQLLNKLPAALGPFLRHRRSLGGSGE